MEIVELTNQIRRVHNLPALKVSYDLNRTAANKAQDMLNKQYFAHTSPQGVTPWDWLEKQNYLYSVAGENLAADFNSPEAAVEGWFASPSHRANLLDPDYQEIGVAIVNGKFQNRESTIFVQYFGTPLANFEE